MRPSFLYAMLCVCATTPATGGLLTNGAFEVTAPRKGKIPGWSLSKEAEAQEVWLDGKGARSGRQCLAIRSIRTTKAPSVVSQRVSLEPHTPYVLSLWAKRDSFVYGTRFHVVLSKDGEAIGNQSKQFRGQDWFPICLAFDSGEADRAEVQITTPNTGTWRITVGRTLWVDDVQLAKIDPQDNLVLSAGQATDTRACSQVKRPGSRGPTCLAVSGSESATFGFDVEPRKGGPYYLWMRASCPSANQFSVRTAEGREWSFRSHTPSKEWRWARPVLPELLLNSQKQRIKFTARGQDIFLDQIVLTMDPFWRPEGAPQLMEAEEAIAAQRGKPHQPPSSGVVGLSVLGQGVGRPWTETRWPVSQGLPFPRGVLAEPDHVSLKDETGRTTPCQASALTRWPDGSVKWLLISTFAPKTSRCHLEYGSHIRLPAISSRQMIVDRPDRIEIDTGKLKACIPRDGSSLFSGIWVSREGAGPRYEQVLAKAVLRANQTFYSSGSKPAISIEERGPVRATIRIAGDFVAAGSALLQYVLRIHAYDNADFLTMEHTFLRRNGALKIPLSDMALVLDLTKAAGLETLSWEGKDGARSAPLIGQRAALVSKIASKPGKASDYPFSVRIGKAEVDNGTQYPGHIKASGHGGAVGAAVRHFWQNSPKSFAVSSQRFEIGLIAPGETVEFFKGMAKTHEIILQFGSDSKPLDCFAAKPLLVASPEWYCKSQAFDAYPAPRSPDGHAQYERCIDATLAKWCGVIETTTFRPGSGGMINVGDFGGRGKFMNLESALGEGFMVQFLRTGSRATFDQADLSLQHFSDIDIDHSNDHAGLIYVHSKHGRQVREDAKEGVNGHSWFNGTTYYGLFTGSRRILEQADDVGRYYTGHEFPLQPYIHYWRKIAWKLMDLMCAYDLTGKVEYLEAARRDVLVTRHQCDHVVTLWPYMCGVGMKALRHYWDVTRDPEARELYLQLMDGFLHLRLRPNDTVNGEHRKRPGMLFGNFPNDRSCAFYNELAHAYFMSGDQRYAQLGASDLGWQVKFSVNDPTLLWGSSDLIAAMQQLDLKGPAVAQTLPGVFMTERAEPSPLLAPQVRPTVTFQVVEKEDRPFTIHLFKGCYHKYTMGYTGRASMYGPDGRLVSEQPVATDGLQDFAFSVPRDGKTGIYTLQVVLHDIWRWTVVDVAYGLTPGKHVLRVAPRYDRICFDRFVLSPDPTWYPWLSKEVSANAIELEAEDAPLAEGYEVLPHPEASGQRYVRSTVGYNKATMNYEFNVPPVLNEPNGARRYRLFARVWKPYADLLNVSMDDQPSQIVQQVHDMNANVYPVWAVGASLGDEAIVRYWGSVRPGKPSTYSAKYLRPTKHLSRLAGQ